MLLLSGHGISDRGLLRSGHGLGTLNDVGEAVPDLVELLGEPDGLSLLLGGADQLDFSEFFGGDIETFTITGPQVLTDNGNGTADFDVSTVSRDTVTVVAANSVNAQAFTATLDVRNPLHSILPFDEASDRSFLKFTDGNGAFILSYVASGQDYQPVGDAAPETIPGIFPTEFPEWDAVNALGFSIGAMVGECQQRGSNHRFAGATMVQKAGQEITINVMGNGRNTGTPVQNQVFVGLSNGDNSLGSVNVSGVATKWLRSFTLPAQLADRQIWVGVRTPNVLDFWSGIGAIWAVADTGVAGEWLDHGSGATVILTGPPVIYHFNPQLGDDANDGSTLALARQTAPAGLPPGSTIFAHGRLTETLLSRVSGTDVNPITYDLSDADLYGGESIIGFAADGSDYRANWPAGEVADETSIYQGADGQIFLAQLPTPTDLALAENPYRDYQLGIVSPTTVNGGGWFAATFTDPANLIGQASVRVWNNGNNVFTYPITGYDAGTDTIAFDVSSGPAFAPYPEAAKQLFAVVDHPECMTTAGQFYHDKVSDDIVARPIGGADLSAEDVFFPSVETGIIVQSDYTDVVDALVVGFAGANSILLDGVTRSSLTRPIVTGGNNTRVISFEGCTECQIVDYDVNNCVGRGLFFSGGTGNAIKEGSINQIKGSGISVYSSTNHWSVAPEVGIITDAHGNAITHGYQGCQDCLLIGAKVRTNVLALTWQSTLGGMQFLLNDLVSDGNTNGVGNAVVNAYASTRNSPGEAGGFEFAFSTVLNKSGNGKSTNFNEAPGRGARVIGNIFDGVVGAGVDVTLLPNAVAIEEVTYVSGGSGHDYRPRSGGIADEVKFSPIGGIAVTEPQMFFATGQATPPASRDEVSMADYGRYASISDVPANPIIFEQGVPPGGAVPMQFNATWQAFAPLRVTGNYHVDLSRQSQFYPEFTPAQLGDFDGTANRLTLFTSFGPDVPIRDVDTTPSGAVILPTFTPETFNLNPHPLFPNAPASITIDSPGPYTAAGVLKVDLASWV